MNLRHLCNQHFRNVTLFKGIALSLMVCLHRGNNNAFLLLVHVELRAANA